MDNLMWFWIGMSVLGIVEVLTQGFRTLYLFEILFKSGVDKNEN